MNALSTTAARALRGGHLPHVPPRAAPINTPVQLMLQAPAGSDPIATLTDVRRGLVWHVALSYVGGECWQCAVLLPSRPTVLTYHFSLNDGRLIQERRQFEGTLRPITDEWQVKDFRVAAYDPASLPPIWTRGAVMYQIFADRFAVSDPNRRYAKHETVYGHEPRFPNWDEPLSPPYVNTFYGGDLRGVIAKLDYLQSLGVTCIYLTPIFESPTCHRYDATDYHRIDVRLGNEDDLRELIVQAKARGVRVMLDGVLNHCSSESVYFRAAKADKTSPWFRCFEFKEWKRVSAPQAYPNAPWNHGTSYPLWPRYTGWADEPSMPEWVECPEMEAFFLGGTGNDGEDGVIPHWMRTGIAGWRTDVTPWITDEFWRRFRQVVRAIDNEAFIIAEDWGDCTPRFLGDTFDATMNYRFGYSVLAFANGTLSPSALDDRLETMRRDYGEPFFQAQINLLDSHDTGRALSYLGGDMQRLRLAVALQLGYPGVPTIFAGDEAGAQGHNMDEGRVPFPWGREDASLLAHYRKAIHARRASNALSLGDVEAALIDDAHGVYGFWRTFENERVLVLLNTSDGPQTVAVPAAACAHAPHLLLGDGDCVVEGDLLHATLPARAAAWVQMRC